MANWFYYDNDGAKQGPVTDGQLKGLAKQGIITPETVVETEGGKTAPARKVKGLTFVETVTETSATDAPAEPKITTWFYFDGNGQKQGPVTGGELKGLAKTGMITPDTIVVAESGKTVPAREVKGLTFIAAQPQTSLPAAPNPFTTAPPFAENPFVASVAPVNQAAQQSAPVPVAAKNSKSPIVRLGIFLAIFIPCFILLRLTGDTEKQEPVKQEPVATSVPVNRNTLLTRYPDAPAKLAKSLDAIQDFNAALIRGNSDNMKAARQDFSSATVFVTLYASSEFNAVLRKLSTAMIELEIAMTKVETAKVLGAKAGHDSAIRDYDRARRNYRDRAEEYAKAVSKETAR